MARLAGRRDRGRRPGAGALPPPSRDGRRPPQGRPGQASRRPVHPGSEPSLRRHGVVHGGGPVRHARDQPQGDRLRRKERQRRLRLRAATRSRQGPEGNRPASAGVPEASGRADERPHEGTRRAGDSNGPDGERGRAAEELIGHASQVQTGGPLAWTSPKERRRKKRTHFEETPVSEEANLRTPGETNAEAGSDDALTRAALDYHRFPTPGKISVLPNKDMTTQRDLALAYSPGVAAACMAIKHNPIEASNLTSRANLVAVITNGTAVLGLGNIGALAGKPVMEGKGCLFKKFAGIDVFDIEIDETDPDKLVEIIASLEPTFGGINREDI